MVSGSARAMSLLTQLAHWPHTHTHKVSIILLFLKKKRSVEFIFFLEFVGVLFFLFFFKSDLNLCCICFSSWFYFVSVNPTTAL